MYDYNKDLIYFIKREGTTQNPYSSIEEDIYVLYEKAFLKEVPVQAFKVVARVGNTTLTEVNSLESVRTTNQYYVNYRQGIIHFHSTKNNVLVKLTYRGQGVLLYPASRIYVDSEGGAKDIVRTLKDLIEEGRNASDSIFQVANIIRRAEIAINSIETAVIDSRNAIASVNNKISEFNTAESNRATAESNRIAREVLRNNAENTRSSNESARVSAETSRVNAELLRVSQEAQRQTASQNAISSINTAKTNAENATSNAISATSETLLAISEARNLVNETVFKEEYNPSRLYKKNNIVSYNGNSYIAKQDTQGNLPTNQVYWGLLAMRGVDGRGSVATVNNTSPDSNGNVTITAEIIGAERTNRKGVANGYVGLDSNAKISLSHIPDTLKQQTYVVLGATQRNALRGLISGDKAYETSTGDSYIYDGSQWRVLADADWENVSLEWVNIINKPTSSVQSIDLSVSNSHTHTNKAVLDKLSIVGGKLQYDGVNIGNVDSVNGLTGVVTITPSSIGAYSKSEIDTITTNINTSINGKISTSEKGVANGVARLNASGKVVDANGNEVEGKVASVNGKTGVVNITPNDINTYSKEEINQIVENVGSELGDSNNIVISSNIPENHSVGGLWFELGSVILEGNSINMDVIEKATFSDDEPTDTTKLWVKPT